MQIHVRWGIRRDMPEVLEIEQEAFVNPWSEDDFTRVLRQRNIRLWVAEKDDKVVGFMIYELHKHHLHILNFAVGRQFRRTGIGRNMVHKLASKLSAQRKNRITLEVRESNLKAQKFFRSMGFRAVNVFRNYYEDSDEDAYHMVYHLPSDGPVEPPDPASGLEEAAPFQSAFWGGLEVENLWVPKEGLRFQGLTASQGATLLPPSEKILSALEPGRDRILVPKALLPEGTRVFLGPGIELDPEVRKGLGAEEPVPLPNRVEEAADFWRRNPLRAGDVVLLQVTAGLEEQWLPPGLPPGAAALNLSEEAESMLTLTNLASMVQAALGQGGLLRVGAVVRTGLEEFVVLDVGA
ncbi:MAG: ribosomal protein S18-alanine N-acetyltransferase [Candidatus Omnitrophica bacterium]|nr:ribosomal protein S18-alanine N-acetyltransferase [Candidatus Omnitrophota bacterium]